MMRCPAFPIDGGVADILLVIDCQTHNAVAEGYARLFGTGGAFGAVLTAGLTIYVAFFAYRLLLGRGSLSLSAVTPRVLVLGLVLTFATSWPAYQAMVFDLLTKGPEEVASIVIGSDATAAQGFVAYLDKLFARLLDVAAQLGGEGEPPKAAVALTPALMIQGSAMILLFGTMGVLVVAKIILAMLLAVGPLFILMALYAGTRGLFEGWLRTSAIFALAPLLTIMVGWAGLTMLSPLITAITSPDAALNPRLAMMLFAGSIIYAVLLFVAFRTAVSVTSGWKPLGAAIFRQDQTAAATGTAGSTASFTSSTSAERIDTVVASVSRDDAMMQASRAAPLTGLPATANDAVASGQPAGTAAVSRNRGLGQTFRARTPAPRQNISGAIRA